MSRLLVVNEAGGFVYECPPGHRVGREVPDNGASCENCHHVSDDFSSCENPYFVAWLTGQRGRAACELPASADGYVCDFWSFGAGGDDV